MGKFKDQFIRINELIEDGYTPRQVALFMGMSVEEVISIMEASGKYFEPVGINDENQ